MISIRNITGYALAPEQQPTKGMSLRKVSGYAMTKTPSQLNIRGAYAYGFYTPVKVILRNKTNKLLLLDLINMETTEAFTLSRISMGPAVVNATPFEKNTSIELSALALSGFRDKVTLKYNRFQIDQYFPDVTWKLTVPVATTLYTLIPAINTAYGCNLVTDDLVDRPIAANVTTFEMTASANSYMFLPGTKVRLGVFDGISLIETVTVKDLPGFDAVVV